MSFLSRKDAPPLHAIVLSRIRTTPQRRPDQAPLTVQQRHLSPAQPLVRFLKRPTTVALGEKGGKGPRSGSRTSCILRSFPVPAMRSGPQLCIHQRTNTNNGKQASSSIHACLLGYLTNTSKVVPEKLIEIVQMTCRTHSGQGSLLVRYNTSSNRHVQENGAVVCFSRRRTTPIAKRIGL